MICRVLLRRAADADIDECFAYYVEQSGGLDVPCRLPDCIRDTLDFLLQSPHVGRLRQGGPGVLEGLRSWPVKGFENLLVFYREVDDGIEVVRVLHGARELSSLLEDGIPTEEEQT